MKQYDVVRVVALRDGRFAAGTPEFKRYPRPGDIGTVLEVYDGGFEVECCEPNTAVPIWIETMFPDEIEMV